MMFACLRNRLRGFHRDDAASLSVEAVLIVPLLLWAFLATFTFFDVYRSKNLALKGNYAISDLLSREVVPINMEYLLGIEDVYTYLTQGGDPAWVRVTVVKCSEDCHDPNSRVLKRDWSYATDGLASHSNTDIARDYADIIPLLALGERVIMVETKSSYDPPFSVYLTGIEARDMIDVVMTRPRFAAQLCWEGQGCNPN